jgi:hypothetical protein
MNTMGTRVVVTDTCILINLIHVGRLSLLGDLPEYEFVIPDHVYEEVTNPEQRRVLDEALAHGRLKKNLSPTSLRLSSTPACAPGSAAVKPLVWPWR